MKFPILMLLLLSTQSFAQEEDPEVECARAVMGYLKQEGVIGGGSRDLCIEGLNDLPQVNIGLGSDTFPVADHDKFNPSSTTKRNIQVIKDLFTEPGKTSFAFLGWADGLNNKMEQLDAQFLEGKDSFTIEDIKKKFANDEPTMKAILDKLKGLPEPIKYEGNPATSLIRNHYLGRERARAVCEVALGAEKCKNNSMLEGYASPLLEEKGQLECGNRRRAIMQVNGTQFASRSPGKNGVFRPQFAIPEDKDERRDMQLAAGLNFFERLSKSTRSSDPETFTDDVIEASMAPDCQKNADVKKTMKDNFRLFRDHAKKLAALSKNEALKKAVFSGDYKTVKGKLEKLILAKSTRDLSADEQADYDLIEVALTGYSSKVTEDFTLKVPNKNLSKPIAKTLQGQTEPVGVKIYYDQNDQAYVLYRDRVYYGQYSKISRMRSITEFKDLTFVYDPKKAYAHYTAYPNAAIASPSTDNLNCLSSAKAVEESLHKHGRDMLFDAEDFVNADPNLKMEMLSGGIPQKGWVCKYCNSGVQVTEPEPRLSSDNKSRYYANYLREFKTLRYVSRDRSVTSGAGFNSVVLQKDDKEMTVGSMKALGVYTISRDAIGRDQCPEGTSVCDCMKDPKIVEGNLDKILASPHSKKTLMADMETKDPKNTLKGFRTTANITEPKDKCLFVPPVPHTCKVGPSGESLDRPKTKKEDALSCKLFAKIKANPTIGANFDEKKAAQYAKVVMGNAICSKDAAPHDEARACSLELKNASGKSSNKPSSSSSGSKQ